MHKVCKQHLLLPAAAAAAAAAPSSPVQHQIISRVQGNAHKPMPKHKTVIVFNTSSRQCLVEAWRKSMQHTAVNV